MGSVESSLERESQGTNRERTGPSDGLIRRIPDVAGVLVAGVGLMVLIGWFLGLDSFKSVLPGLATMKANTALCFLFSGLALALREKRAPRLICAGIVCAVAGLTLAEYIGGMDLGLDQLLFRDTVDPHTVYPGRMAEATALGFLLSGASLLLLGGGSRGLRRAQQALAVFTGVIGVIAVLGYAYNAQQLYRFAGYSSMAVHTAVSFIVLALGLILARPDGLARMLTLPGPSSQVIRRLLPMTLLIPAVTGWLVGRGLERGFYGEGMDLAILALAMMFSLAALVWWTATALNRTDAGRKRAEEAIKQSHNTFTELIERSPFGIYVVDSQFRIAMMNASSQEGAFRNVRPVVGRPFEEAMRTLWPESVAVEIIGHFRHTLDTGEPFYSRDFVRPRSDVEMVEAYEWELHRMTLPDGQHGVICYYYDSTKLREVEESLRASEERLRSLAENIPCVLMRFDRQLRILYLNPQSEQYNAIPVERLIGRTNREVGMPTELCDLWDAAIERVFSTGTQEEMEFGFAGPSGMRTFALAFAPEFGPDHEVRYVLGVSSDITERKLAVEALREAESEKALILDNANEIIAYHDANNNLLWANRAYLNSTGLPMSEMKGRKCYNCWGLDSLCVQCPVVTAIQTGEPQEFELTPENQPHWPADQGSWLVKAAPVRDSDGNVIGAIEVAHDITKRKQAEEELRASNREMEEFNRAMVGRELRMIELKREINEVCAQLGRPPRYPFDEEQP